MQSFALTSSVPIVRYGVASELSNIDHVTPDLSTTRPLSHATPPRLPLMPRSPDCAPALRIRRLATPDRRWIDAFSLAVKSFYSSHPSSCGLDLNIAPIASADIKSARPRCSTWHASRTAPHGLDPVLFRKGQYWLWSRSGPSYAFCCSLLF
jgi:hypothetical protein